MQPEATETNWKARALEAERKAAEAWEAYHRLAAQQVDALHYKTTLEQLEQSRSWRLTAPLRQVKLIADLVIRLARRFTGR